MLDEKNGNLEVVTNLKDIIHKLVGLCWVHTCSRLVEQQNLWLSCQSTKNLKLTLSTIRQVTCKGICKVLHTKNAEQLSSVIGALFLLLPVSWKTKDVLKEMRRHVAALANLDVLHNSHVVEKANVLEGTSNAHVICLNNALTSQIVAVNHDGTACWLVDVGEQVEDSCFTCTVRADNAGNLGRTKSDVEVINSSQATKVNAQVLSLKNWNCAKVSLRNEVRRLLPDKFCSVFSCHRSYASFESVEASA